MADSNSERPASRRPTPRTSAARANPSSLSVRHLHAPGLFAHGAIETGGGAGMPGNWQRRLPVPCHGSTFDMAGRVYKDKPAPDNLEVPPYQYLSDTRIIVGVDKDNKA